MKIEELTFTVKRVCPGCRGSGSVENPVVAEWKAHNKITGKGTMLATYFKERERDVPVLFITCLRCDGEKTIEKELAGWELRKLLAEA